ncbi:hypothetical protein H9Q10_10905 [Eikenella sp. S3360]|uniref:DUF2059 domain-containing protein n=1 Tax=Eikenella glucosivorans TaxID=2766967 RepID=A0ABS0NCX7_9NEIS|nr:hypothetical protein [Eikenella glucosivorans]MBH5330171.1 hypothetical protein [Eikenella glucosivorans]
MKKTMAAALLGCWLVSAYAENSERLDQAEFTRQAQIAARYLGDQASNQIADQFLAMTPEQQREFDRRLADKQQAARWESELRGQVMRQFADYIVQCYAENKADLCAYRDIAGQEIMRKVLEQSNDKQPLIPLHQQTQSWVARNSRQATEALQTAEWIARLAILPGRKGQ